MEVGIENARSGGRMSDSRYVEKRKVSPMYRPTWVVMVVVPCSSVVSLMLGGQENDIEN
jgi:hypothetical protein